MIWVEAVCGDSERHMGAALRKGPEGSAERGQEDGDAKPTDVKKKTGAGWEGKCCGKAEARKKKDNRERSIKKKIQM